jgi:hypothetical protein
LVRRLGLPAFMVLSRLDPRAVYPAGLALASAALRLRLLALLVALSVATGRLRWLLPLAAVPLTVASVLLVLLVVGGRFFRRDVQFA